MSKREAKNVIRSRRPILLAGQLSKMSGQDSKLLSILILAQDGWTAPLQTLPASGLENLKWEVFIMKERFHQECFYYPRVSEAYLAPRNYGFEVSPSSLLLIGSSCRVFVFRYVPEFVVGERSNWASVEGRRASGRG